MSKRTSRKTDTATEGASSEEVPSFDATMFENANVREAHQVEVKFADGRTDTFLIDIPPGFTKEQALEHAMEFARQMRRVEQAWTADEESGVLQEGRSVLRSAATIVVANLYRIGERIHGAAIADAIDDDWDQDAAIDVVMKAFLSDDAQATELGVSLQQQTVATIFAEHVDEEALPEEEFERAFRDAMSEHAARHWGALAKIAAQDIARRILDDLDPTRLSVEEFRAFLLPSKDAPETVSPMLRSVAAAGVPILTDRGVEALAKYVGGRSEPERRDAEGYDVLVEQAPVRRGSYDLTLLSVRPDPARLTELVQPESVEPVLARIQQERNETKAKVLVAALSYAASLRTNAERGAFIVDLHDLVNLVSGYKRSGPAKTQHARYHAKVAEIFRYLHLDLAHLQVNIRVVRQSKSGVNELEFMGMYLMERPHLIAKQEFLYDKLNEELRRLLLEEETPAGAIEYLKQIQPTGIELGFPERILAALGVDTHARELANREVLRLKGATFWLAYDVTFRRRWSQRRTKRGSGVPLLTVLKEHGFVDESVSKTGNRPSYKVALGRFFAAVDELVGLGELDEPGVEIWKRHGGVNRARNVEKELRAWPKQRGRRITEESLDEYLVKYVHREDRLKELEDVRRRSRRTKRRG